MASDDILIGRKAIAHAYRCSEKTVSRRFAKGKLPGAYKDDGGASPIKMRLGGSTKTNKRRGR